MAPRLLPMALLGLLLSGCAHRCEIARDAATAANVACAAVSVAPNDPLVLVRCEAATVEMTKAVNAAEACREH